MSKYICLILLINIIYCDWITIDDNSVRTWNENNADRPLILRKFQIINYPSKYSRSLNNLIDTYTYDDKKENIYFIMQQSLYGISKFFKYNLITNQIYQTEQIQYFMIDHIQFNSKSNKLYSIINNSTQNQRILIELDKDTLEMKREIIQLSNYGSPMPGSYFNSQTQLFTYHAYDFKQSNNVLITLDLSDNATKIFTKSIQFYFNVYAFGYIQSENYFIALWQYSIITPIIAIKIDLQTGKQIQNITITPNGQRIAEGYKPFAMDFQNKLFYVLSTADHLSTTFISKINIQTMKVKTIKIKGNINTNYIFFKTN